MGILYYGKFNPHLPTLVPTLAGPLSSHLSWVRTVASYPSSTLYSCFSWNFLTELPLLSFFILESGHVVLLKAHQYLPASRAKATESLCPLHCPPASFLTPWTLVSDVPMVFLELKARSLVWSSAPVILLTCDTPRHLRDCFLTLLLVRVLQWPSEAKACGEVLIV